MANITDKYLYSLQPRSLGKQEVGDDQKAVLHSDFVIVMKFMEQHMNQINGHGSDWEVNKLRISSEPFLKTQRLVHSHLSAIVMYDNILTWEDIPSTTVTYICVEAFDDDFFEIEIHGIQLPNRKKRVRYQIYPNIPRHLWNRD